MIQGLAPERRSQARHRPRPICSERRRGFEGGRVACRNADKTRSEQERGIMKPSRALVMKNVEHEAALTWRPPAAAWRCERDAEARRREQRSRWRPLASASLSHRGPAKPGPPSQRVSFRTCRVCLRVYTLRASFFSGFMNNISNGSKLQPAAPSRRRSYRRASRSTATDAIDTSSPEIAANRFAASIFRPAFNRSSTSARSSGFKRPTAFSARFS